MSKTNQTPTSAEDWNEFMEEMNQNVLDALERNVEAQTTFVEAWMNVLADSTTDGSFEATFEEGVEGYARAYEVWMEAAQEQFERMSDAIEGEEVEPEEFRDIWLNTANDAFKEVMSTNAFAAATGRTVENLLEFRQDVDETAEQTLHNLRLATVGDVEEIGERLVELERRQHGVEREVEGVGERFDAVEDRLVTVDDRILQFGDNFDRIEERLDSFEGVGDRLDSFEDDFGEVGGRLDEIGSEFDDVGTRLDEVEERLDGFEERFDRLDEQLDEIADAVGEE